MQVWIDKYELAGPDPSLTAVSEFQSTRQTSIQIATFLRGVKAKAFNRGNSLRRVTFTVTRLHESMTEAELFLLTHEEELPTSGLVRFVADDGDARAERFIDAGSIEAVSSRHAGCSTIHTYQIVGSEISKKKS